MTYSRYVLAAFSDTHAGHRLGLCNPDVTIQQEGPDGEIEMVTPQLTASQEHLWSVWLAAIESVRLLAGKSPVVGMHLGDQTEGKKHESEWMSTALSDQVTIAAANLIPWLELRQVKMLRQAIGTGAHTFGQGSAEVLATNQLKALYPKKDITLVYHGLSRINGLVVDYAHHGPYPGSRNWLKGNVARYYLRSMQLDDIVAARRPPDLVLRGHYHTYVKEYLETGGAASWLVVLPSMCLLSEFARQVTRSVFIVTNGVVAFEAVDGKIRDIQLFGQTLDVRTKEEVTL